MSAPDRTTFDHMAACELAEKRAIAVYGAVFAEVYGNGRRQVEEAHFVAAETAGKVPRPEPFRVPTALERQQGQVR